MEEYINDLEFNNKVLEMYTKINEDITSSIIKSIKESGDISSFTKSKYQTLVKTNGKKIFDDALKQLNGISDSRYKELQLLFEEVANESLNDYQEVFDELGEEIGLKNEQIDILRQNINLANKEFENLTQTVAFKSEQEYIKAIDQAYLGMSTGGMTFQEAYTSAATTLAQQGVVLDSGKKTISIEAQVRQGLKYSLTKSLRDSNEALDKELGTDGVQINISPNCRPGHIPINGKRFSNSEYKKYEYLLAEYGCQHYATGIFMDISKNRYTNAEIKSANEKTVTYNGKSIPYYEATQKQRQLERLIRNAKSERNILNNNNLDSNQASEKVNYYQAKMRDFISQTGIYRDRDREQVYNK